MIRRVLEWRVPADGDYHAVGAGPVVLVGYLNDVGSPAVVVWTLETETTVKTFRTARIYRTNQVVPDDEDHLGSVITEEGRFVFHCFAAPI